MLDMRCLAIILLAALSGCSKAQYDDHVILPNAYPVAKTDDHHLLVVRDNKQDDQFYLVFDALDATKMSIKPFTAKAGNCFRAACRQDGQRVYFVYSPAKVDDRIVIDEYDVESGNLSNSWTLETKYACSCHTVLTPFHHDQLAISISITCIGDDIPYVPETTLFHFDTKTGTVVKERQLNCLISDMQPVPSLSKFYVSMQDPAQETSWLETWTMKDSQIQIDRSKQPPLRKELVNGKVILLTKSPDDRYLCAVNKHPLENNSCVSVLIRTADDLTTDAKYPGVPIWPTHKSDELWFRENNRVKAAVIKDDLTLTTTKIKAFHRIQDATVLFETDDSVIAFRPNNSDGVDLLTRRRKKGD
jgi:hypothetical protein